MFGFTDAKKTATTVASIVTFLGSVVAGVLYVDTRYAHADEINQIKKEQKTENADIQVQLKDMRRQQLEDKIFDLNLKPVKTTVDKAQLDRANQQLQEVNQEIDTLRNKK